MSVKYETSGAVATITLDRPAYRNAQSSKMRRDLVALFARAEESPDIRVIILAATGDDFSSGQDLGTEEEMADPDGRASPSQISEWYSWLRRTTFLNMLSLRKIEKPTIAQVQGRCIFTGWTLASTMDLVVCSDDALILPEHTQLLTLPWDVSARKAKELLFRGKFITAQEAENLGMVNKVVPRGDLKRATQELAHEIAENDPLLLQLAKLSINSAQDSMGYQSATEIGFAAYVLRHEHRRASAIPGSGLGKRGARVERAVADQGHQQ